ncbi:MAG: DUF2145 domain-containing protein [Betaproteobacteria bacterium]
MSLPAARVAARTVAACALAAALLVAAPCRANSLEVCDRPREPSADEKDVMLRFGALVREALAASGHDVALIARSGLDLHRLDVRYSHEGIALKDSAATPWSVRELYYSCDEHKPRVYDEGLAGFVMGTDDPTTSFVSLVFLPDVDADTLRRAALDKRQSLAVLGASYSANAYAFNTVHQNCNQWVMELIASAGGADGRDDAPDAADHRARAQRWLRAQGYLPTVFTVSAHPMMWIADVLPWLANDDHPAEEVAHNRYNVSMPTSIETFVQAKADGATRVELCHNGRHVVIHDGWTDIAAGCVEQPGDRVIELERD